MRLTGGVLNHSGRFWLCFQIVASPEQTSFSFNLYSYLYLSPYRLLTDRALVSLHVEMEPNPLINAPSADSGQGGVEHRNCREFSPPISLGLGIGAGGARHVIKQGRSAFTPAQAHELQQQSLVLKYLAAGLPVPFHLILPIWKSVARSFGSDNAGTYNHYPSFIGFYPQGFDHRSMMDPEPGRCRRTDGKKWRCSRDVLPDAKYCERHIHRGRSRSRKHVEASEIASESNSALNPHNIKMILNPGVSADSKSNLSISIPVNLQLTTPSSSSISTGPAAAVCAATFITGGSGSDNNIAFKKDSIATTTIPQTTSSCSGESNRQFHCNKDVATTTVDLLSAASDSRSKNESLDGSHCSNSQTNSRTNIKGSSNNVNDCQVVGCSSPCADYRNVVETETYRCRRTDGKKWRCSRDVVPDQKYCGRHLHRGARRLEAPSQSVTVAAAAPTISNLCLAPPLGIPKKADGYIKLDTNLSISIAGNPGEAANEKDSPTGGCSNSSSSDATTITDENGSISHLLTMSS